MEEVTLSGDSGGFRHCRFLEPRTIGQQVSFKERLGEYSTLTTITHDSVLYTFTLDDPYPSSYSQRWVWGGVAW